MVGLIGMLAGEVIFETVRFIIMLILLVAAFLLGGKLRGISDKKKEEKKASEENILAVIDPIKHGLDMLFSEGSADCGQ